MKMLPFCVWAIAAAATLHAAVEPEIATFSFDTLFNQPDAVAKAQLPAWVTKVEQQGGRFSDDPRCWQVAAGGPEGAGRLEITIDREKMGSNLVATVLFDADDDGDVAIQLFDRFGRAVVVDLFGNLVDVGKKAMTDTFIVPWKRYPTAEKIVLRRISGALKVYGVVLYPVITEGTPVKGALEELARVLGDPLSPENPLLQNLQEIAKGANVAISSAASTKPSAPVVRGSYPGAVAPVSGRAAALPPSEGLVAHWSFDSGDATDVSGRGNDGRLQAGATIVASPHGKALRLRKNPSPPKSTRWDAVTVLSSPSLELKETVTVAAWINYTSIAPKWGAQIVWHGDYELGRDPWVLHLLNDRTVEFRSDRSVTGRPIFTVFENEIYLSPQGKPTLNQHVGVASPHPLEAGKWYFVAGTMEKTSPRASVLRLYVNGEPVAELKTEEKVNYDTSKMWTEIGSVDSGSWQNFDGDIDEVRIYDRALTAAEIKALYEQPWE